MVNELFFSQIVKSIVFEPSEKRVGRIRDISFSIEDVFPKVNSVLIQRKRESFFVPVENIDWAEKGKVYINTPVDEVKKIKPDEKEILIGRDVLDKQVVDTHGRKVVRVNDIRLAKVNEDLRIIAVDIGFRGLIGRLGIETIFDKLCKFFSIEIPSGLIGWNYIESLSADLQNVRLAVPYKKLAIMHPSDIADIVNQLSINEGAAIFRSLNTETAAETLYELDPEMQTTILETLGDEQASEILEEMPPDEAADVLSDLSDERAHKILDMMEEEEADEVEELMCYDEKTAGGLMTTEFIAFPQNVSAQETIDKLRELAPESETIYYLYVIDENNHLVGVLSLRDLIVANPQTPLSDIMIKEAITVGIDEGYKDIAEVISKYNLLAVPVVDKKKKLVGIVTVDDVMDIVVPKRPRRYRKMR